MNHPTGVIHDFNMSNEMKVEVEGAVGLDNEQVGLLVGILVEMRRAVQIDRFRFKATASDPNEYIYDVRHSDSRLFAQRILFNGPVDMNPPMTFDVPEPGWKLSEFSLQRSARDVCVRLHSIGLTSIVVTWVY